MSEENKPVHETIEYTSNVVSSYVANNQISTEKLPKLITSIYRLFSELSKNPKGQLSNGASINQEPAVTIKKSLSDKELICLECGKPLKSLKRHLRTEHNLTPEQYRSKWGLAPDYPMVPPAYRKIRSNIAKDLGLGRKAGRKTKT